MKFVGAGVTEKLYELVPDICGRLWRELDIVPLVRLNQWLARYGVLTLRGRFIGLPCPFDPAPHPWKGSNCQT